MRALAEVRPLLDVHSLSVEFGPAGAPARAVNDVSYSLSRGETLGIVGESGSGKSVHLLAMLGLIPCPPARITSGSVMFDGTDLLRATDRELTHIRGRRIGYVFQDPLTSLNPVLSIGDQMTEGLRRHLRLRRAAAERRAAELLDLVGISEPALRLWQYPHEMSGGMRQRVMIAIAIACEPELLIADEPTTALDVTVQAQIVELIKEIRKTIGLSIIWVSHDLAVIAGIADTVQVMYAGRILERGPVDDVFYDPRNAYTLGLLQSLPKGEAAEKRRLTQIEGSPADPSALPAGDPFAPRNPYATPRCLELMPPLRQVREGAPGHLVATWYDLKAARNN